MILNKKLHRQTMKRICTETWTQNRKPKPKTLFYFILFYNFI